MNPTSCVSGSRFVYFFPLADALLFVVKNPPKVCTILVWIAGFWNSSNILLRSHNTTVEKIVVCAHTNRDPNEQEVGFIFE
jgi:hypothetical protein